MTAAPVMSITEELIAELEAAASYCVTEVIRSHPWSEQEFDLLRADERYIRAASPELVRALLAERAELKRDAERYRWLRDRLIGASFDWDGEGMTVIAFQMLDSITVSANCDKVVDDAMQAAQ